MCLSIQHLTAGKSEVGTCIRQLLRKIRNETVVL